MVSVSTASASLDVTLPVGADVRQLPVAGDGEQPPRQPTVIDVAVEVAVHASQTLDIEPDVGRIDLRLQGPHGQPVKQAARQVGAHVGGGDGAGDLRPPLGRCRIVADAVGGRVGDEAVGDVAVAAQQLVGDVVPRADDGEVVEHLVGDQLGHALRCRRPSGAR